MKNLEVRTATSNVSKTRPGLINSYELFPLLGNGVRNVLKTFWICDKRWWKNNNPAQTRTKAKAQTKEKINANVSSRGEKITMMIKIHIK